MCISCLSQMSMLILLSRYFVFQGITQLQSLYVFPSGCHWSKLLCRTLLLFLLQSTHNIQMSLFTRVHFILLSKYTLACGTIVCRCSFDWKTWFFHTSAIPVSLTILYSPIWCLIIPSLPNLMLNHPLPVKMAISRLYTQCFPYTSKDHVVGYPVVN